MSYILNFNKWSNLTEATGVDPIVPTQPAFKTLESVWEDPKLKSEVGVTAKEQEMGFTRESKFNRIVIANLVNYYGNGVSLPIGKNAIGWPYNDDKTKDLLLQEVSFNFPIVEIYRGFNHGFQNTMFEPSTEPCIFITSAEVKVEGRYGNQGTLYVSPDDFDATDATKNYKQLGIPTVPHIRLIGSNAYYFSSKDSSNFKQKLVTTPFANDKMVNALAKVK